jgi:hypothetical protein
LVHIFATRWSAEGIKLFGYGLMTIPFEIATQFRCIPPPFEKSLETLDNLQESH